MELHDIIWANKVPHTEAEVRESKVYTSKQCDNKLFVLNCFELAMQLPLNSVQELNLDGIHIAQAFQSLKGAKEIVNSYYFSTHFLNDFLDMYSEGETKIEESLSTTWHSIMHNFKLITARKVVVASNNLPSLKVQSLCNLIFNLEQMEELDLSKNPIESQGFLILSEGLVKTPKMELKKLSVSHCGIDSDETCIKGFQLALSALGYTLKSNC
eukprot:TRINITY_DN11972_c0_g1_i2.p2 TRINITY_DN11972_c0_g1~~TRINITY_DN11972_c0_g1_i2.p2  ORF type:complete len:213 (-),score=23.04 TRINITY_DN11972_c0_g1_i2:303-941(-)